ncbi:hypothetical protein RB608_21890 [Nocardioides sp. LHD-245]|uniref:hypothetical protein n=1 Tax=Nocardioides sp. LHD-245 TaxID=3051387 RepID=UPI0027E1D05F|nr:hypothetical protein [Nocardioides sp. LHD-245]
MSADTTGFVPLPLVAGPGPVADESSLGRVTRTGSWSELGEGTFAAAGRALSAGRPEDAARLVEVSLLEADELRDVYGSWPGTTAAWVRARGVDPALLEREEVRLRELLGQGPQAGIAERWGEYVERAEHAATLCRSGPAAAAGAAVEEARACWQDIHDDAVDLVSGMVDVAVRLVGEQALGDLWDHLMADWYDVHERRYALASQPWTKSARQLAVAVFDGFHAHLTGPDRSGAVEVIEEADRIGFRFAPCGSGGRSLAAGITGGSPRAAAPYDFAVTTQPHDWAWNTVGICSYCVHCCQLNEVMPIDRLGYPTRVIDAPTWPATEENPSCTWWIYRDPSLVPDAVYERVGRSPRRRPSAGGGAR